jgi:hypothetical protein
VAVFPCTACGFFGLAHRDGRMATNPVHRRPRCPSEQPGMDCGQLASCSPDFDPALGAPAVLLSPDRAADLGMAVDYVVMQAGRHRGTIPISPGVRRLMAPKTLAPGCHRNIGGCAFGSHASP